MANGNQPPTTVYLTPSAIPKGQTGVVAASPEQAAAIARGDVPAPAPVKSTVSTRPTPQQIAISQAAAAGAAGAAVTQQGRTVYLNPEAVPRELRGSPDVVVVESQEQARELLQQPEAYEERVEAQGRSKQAEVKVSGDIAFKPVADVLEEQRGFKPDIDKAWRDTKRQAEQEYSKAYSELGPAFIGEAVKNALGLDYTPTAGEAKRVWLDSAQKEFSQRELTYSPNIDDVASIIRAENIESSLRAKGYLTDEGLDTFSIFEDEGEAGLRETLQGFKLTAKEIGTEIVKVQRAQEAQKELRQFREIETRLGRMSVLEAERAREKEAEIRRIQLEAGAEAGRIKTGLFGPVFGPGISVEVPGARLRLGAGVPVPSFEYTGPPAMRELAQEALSLGTVETRLMNEDDIRARYKLEVRLLDALYAGDSDEVNKLNEEGFFGEGDTGREAYLESRDIAIESSKAEGKPTQTKENFIKDAIGTEDEYLQETLKQQPGVLSLMWEYVPFSEWSRLERFKGRGALGYTELAGQTLLSAALITPVVGWAGKGSAKVLRKLTTGGKIGALGGMPALEATLNTARKALKEVKREIPAKAKEIKKARQFLHGATKAKLPATDIALRKAELKLLDEELAALKAGGHLKNVAAKQAEVKLYDDLISSARANPIRTRIQERTFLLEQKAMVGSAKISKPLLYSFGAVEGGLTAYKWPVSTPMEKIVGVGMTAFAFGIPGKAIKGTTGAVKSQAEIWGYPGRIPQRTITVPEAFLPSGMGMPKTSVRGLTTEQQLAAMEAEAWALEQLFKHGRPVGAPWPTGKQYRVHSFFQWSVPKTAISATPSLEMFGRPIVTVQKFREPFFFSAPWLFPKFTQASAAGLKGGKQGAIVVFSERISPHISEIARARTPAEMQRAASRIATAAELEPGLFPGAKLYKGAKEPEFISPVGTELGQVIGGETLWTRATPFGPRIQLKPVFIMAEPGARRTGFTKVELLKLKTTGVSAEFWHRVEKVSLRRGLTGERSMIRWDFTLDPLRELRSRLAELVRLEEKASAELATIKKAKTPSSELKNLSATNRAKIKAFEEGRISEAKTALASIESNIARTTNQLRVGEGLRRIERSLSETTRRAYGENIARAARREIGTERGEIAVPRYRLEATRERPEFRIPERLDISRFEVPRLERLPFERGRIIRPEAPRLITERIEAPRPERIPRDVPPRIPPRVPPRVPPERPPREEVPRLEPVRDMPFVGRAPREVPERVPPPTPSRKIIPFMLPEEEEVAPEDKIYPAGTVVWRQGMLHGKDIWYVVAPPYDTEHPIMLTEAPAQAKHKDVRGPRSAYRTVQVIGGNPPGDIDIDLGWTDIHIDTSGDEPVISFRSGGEKTDTGKRDASPTKGMSVSGEASGGRSIPRATREPEPEPLPEIPGRKPSVVDFSGGRRMSGGQIDFSFERPSKAPATPPESDFPSENEERFSSTLDAISQVPTKKPPEPRRRTLSQEMGNSEAQPQQPRLNRPQSSHRVKNRELIPGAKYYRGRLIIDRYQGGKL